ncbi:hypothetical protein DOTSEDRAFT_169606 [Dothistroma septosporum NZE10]|uniref:WSC domain-containing protein n=1 Tax=Dothistroma septosporum (strain NZE10 / CBS 128990) TaxID=675120 RepID=N1PTT6_DOTSN|nr:hypothetical protein DOTSEDRAFT_169606 [Dothistroma septosporum NZE10]
MYCATLLLLALGAAAQQYAGDVIGASLPTVDGAEVAFFKINDPSGKNNNLTLINYYGLGSNYQRIDTNNIQRAVITIHGLLRDPNNYFNDTRNALIKATAEDGNINSDSVAIMAPFFPNGDDKGYGYPWTDGVSPGEGSTSNALVWAGSQWSKGANNQYPTSSTDTSSFYVLDQIIQYFNDATTFPNLHQIVLVGHSMGGQMLQRYAAVGDNLNTRVPVTYWVGNPNSYSWLSPYRPLNTSDCATFDDYSAGYTAYEDYGKGGMTYGLPIVQQGIDAVRTNYDSKQIAYARALLDHGDHSSGEGCAPYSSGNDRHERFFYFIRWFPARCPDPSSANCDTVDLINVSHDNGQMFGSDAGLARLFKDNFYGDNSRAYDFGYPRQQDGDCPYPDPSQSTVPSTPALANENVYAGNMTYAGCYTDQEPVTPAALPSLMYDDAGNSIEGCTNACNDNGFSIAGMMNGTQCLCGNALNGASAVTIVDSACRTVCPGNVNEVCGANQRLSVYSNGTPAFY